MSIFNVRKNFKNDADDCVAYFDNGFLINVSPRAESVSLYNNREVAYNATVIYSDGKRYSLLNAKSIQQIPVPEFSDSQDTVFSLDYVLRMCASNLRNAGNRQLSVQLLQKAVEIMPFSNIAWKEDDYLRLALWLYEDGRIKEGLDVERRLKADVELQRQVDVKKQIDELRSHSDLVVYSSYSGVCCADCAKRSGRVYSFSGKDSKYPQLPPDVLTCCGFHPGCNAGLSRYYTGNKIYYMGNLVDEDKSTFRDYKDERTADDIQRYEQNQKRINQLNLQFANKKEYLILRTLFPEDIPKSQYKFACKKVDDPLWYSDMHTQVEKKIALLLGAGEHKG